MKENMYYTTMAFLISGVLSFAHADEETGLLTIQGEITDAACAIATGSKEQSIDLGTIPISLIKQDGKGPEKSFSIHLINCNLIRHNSQNQLWNAVELTFDGPSEDNIFSIFGYAQGVGLSLRNSSDINIIPGRPVSKIDITPPSMRLDYHVRLVSNTKPLQSGSYYSAIRFKLEYY